MQGAPDIQLNHSSTSVTDRLRSRRAISDSVRRVARLSDRNFALVVGLVALVVRLAWVVFWRPVPLSDFDFYYQHGVIIAQGRGYVHADGTPTAYWPVGYPAFLGGVFRLFGPSVLVAELANVVLGAATVVLFYLLARRLARGRLVARLSAVLLAFWPNQIAYTSLVSDSILFEFLAVLLLLTLVGARETWRLGLVGLLTGLAALVRPYGLLLPLAMAVLPWPGARLGRLAGHLALAYGIAILVLIPWTVRNYDVFHAFVFVSNNGGETLLIGNSPYANGTDNELGGSLIPSDVTGEYATDQAAKSIAIRYMLDHPIHTVAMVVPKLWFEFAEDAEGLRWNLKGTRDNADLRSGAGGYGAGVLRYHLLDYASMGIFEIYYLVGLAGFAGYAVLLVRGGSRSTHVGPLPLLMLAFTALIGAVFMGQPRFHFPAVPFIALGESAFLLSPGVRSVFARTGRSQPGAGEHAGAGWRGFAFPLRTPGPKQAGPTTRGA